MKTTIKTLLLLAFATAFNFSSFGNVSSLSFLKNNLTVDVNDSIKNEQVKTSVENAEETQTVLYNAEKMPEYNGGTKALVQYLRRNVNYPQEIREKEIEDKVYVEFVVNPDGSISDIKALTGKNKRLIEEAVKVVDEMPKWIPATEKGETVPVKLILPISFVLK